MSIEARAAVTAQLLAIVAAGRPDLAMQLDINLPFTPPNAAPWLRLAFLDGDEAQVAMGGSSSPYRQPLLAYFDIFTPGGTGDGDAVAINKIITEGFRRWEISGCKWARFQSGPEGRNAAESDALYRKQLIAVFTLSFRG